jgi:hypothetical protein
MQAQGDRSLPMDQHFEKINGSPQYLGTIQSTGSNVISNLSSAIQKGYRLLVQPDATGYLLASDSATVPTTVNSATTGVKLSGDEKFYICLKSDLKPGSSDGEGWLQWISGSGTTNLKVWRLA